MKKTSFMMALTVAAGLASCTAQSSKGDLQSTVDSLSYAIGMARTQGLEQYLMQQGVDSTHMSTFLKGFKEGASKTDPEDMAYVTGMQVGQLVSKGWVEGLNQQLFPGDSVRTINRENLLAGFIAGVLKEGGQMEMALAQDYTRRKMEAVKEEYLSEKYADNKAAGEKFLAENKEKEGVVTTESGLQYKIITKGTGEVPEKNSRVQVNYRGTLVDGTEFDSSYKHPDKDGNTKPSVLRVNQVIPGWSEALLMMPVGSKWEIYLPYDLAYGSRESGAHIKPYSALVFEVELVGIEKNTNKKK